jgi:hypothetical protein
MVESCVRVINDATPFLPRYHHRWTAARMGYYVLRTARRRQLPTHNIEVRRSPHIYNGEVRRPIDDCHPATLPS